MNIVEFKDFKPSPDIIYPYSSDLYQVPIIIDNGSYQSRVGWAVNSEPLLLFRNLIAKLRKERSKKDNLESNHTPQLQVGNDIANIEAVRFQLKTQFDRNVVTHFEVQEHIFDYTFTHLGINTENHVPHPIVITEAFLNPNSSRLLMSELLFEYYGVPGIAYGIDSLYSYHFSHSEPKADALLVSLGYQTIHVIPVVNGKTIFNNTRRINIGGSHIISFLQRILQLKYPIHSNSITLSRAEELLHSICLVAPDYKDELKRWSNSEYYNANVKKIQLPFISSSQLGLTVEQQKERKKELARRLAEINARKREERLMGDEEKLHRLLEIQEMIESDEDSSEIERALLEHEIKNVDDLHKTITHLNTRIEKTKEKILASMSEDIITEEPPSKQSKVNKMIFESESAKSSFIQKIKKMRQDILNKKTARRQRRQDMAKRRTAAGQERMRLISQLARKEKGYDDFGYRDEDWDIYKAISREGGDSDSDVENEKLMEFDEILREHEPAVIKGTSSELHQLHIGLERYRAPELIFKPYMIGLSEAGLSEVIAYVLSLFDQETQASLAANVVLIGGLANLPGLLDRIKVDLVSNRPFQSHCYVYRIENPSLAAWEGTKKWIQKSDFKNYMLTKEEYEEYGGEYFKAHVASNQYIPTPKNQFVDLLDS